MSENKNPITLKNMYIALLKPSAIRDAQVCMNAELEPMDDDAWYDCADTPMYLGAYIGSQAKVLAAAAAYAQTSVENIRLLCMADINLQPCALLSEAPEAGWHVRARKVAGEIYSARPDILNALTDYDYAIIGERFRNTHDPAGPADLQMVQVIHDYVKQNAIARREGAPVQADESGEIPRNIAEIGTKLLNTAADDYASRIWSAIRQEVIDTLTPGAENSKEAAGTAVANAMGRIIAGKFDPNNRPGDSAVIKNITETAMSLLRVMAGESAEQLWSFIGDTVITDVMECTDEAADGFTDGDVALAIGRVVAATLGFEV